MTAIPEAAQPGVQAADAYPLSLRTKLGYGLGSTAIGIIQYGLTSLVLIFYNQVVGLPAQTVGLAIMLALFVDAFWDPVLGHTSDQLRAAWGRRHPFMYASAIPIAIAFYLLWNPPHPLTEAHAFIYLLAALIGTRIMVSLYEIPSASLAPELAPGYHQRTGLLGYRFFFLLLGTLFMGVLAFNVLLVPNETYSNGMLNREGYGMYGLIAAAIILVTIIASAASTHHEIPRLHKPPKRKIPVRQIISDIGHTLWNRSLIALTVAGMLGAISRGLDGGLGVYFGIYFWEMRSQEISYLAISSAIATLIAVMAAPALGKRLGKKRAVIFMFFATIFINTAPPVLRLLDLAPPNGTPELLALLVTSWVIGGVTGFTVVILLGSMIADIVEDSQVKTGRRSEGLLFSADNMLQKCVTGFGVFFSGLMLAAVHFPANADPNTLDYNIVRNLALLYFPVVTVLNLAAAGCIWFYKIDQTAHEENLRRLGVAG